MERETATAPIGDLRCAHNEAMKKIGETVAEFNNEGPFAIWSLYGPLICLPAQGEAFETNSLASTATAERKP